MRRELIRRRQLPHWDVGHAAYFVTACLEGSIPAQGLLDLRRYREELARTEIPEGQTKAQWQMDNWKLEFARADRWLDFESANRALADTRLARLVVDSMFHFAGVRYDLLAFVVMPSHIHCCSSPRKAGWQRCLPNPRRRASASCKA